MKRKETLLAWQGFQHDWLPFNEAVEGIARDLGVGLGKAQSTLRQLCASGEVQSLKYHGEFTEDNEVVVSPGHLPERIKPTEWQEQELDLTVDDDVCIEIFEADLRHWLAQTGLKSEPKKVSGGKQPRIQALLAELFPNGVPDPAHCPRKALKADLLKRDPSLNPLDEATLKSAIEAYNSDPKRS